MAFLDWLERTTERMRDRNQAHAEKMQDIKYAMSDAGQASRELTSATKDMIKEMPGAKTTGKLFGGAKKAVKFGAIGAAALGAVGALAYFTSQNRAARKFNPDNIPMPEPMPAMMPMDFTPPQEVMAEPSTKDIKGPFTAKALQNEATKSAPALGA